MSTQESSESLGDLGDLLDEFDQRSDEEKILDAKKSEPIDTRNLAGILGVHPISIKKWEREGLPTHKRGGRGVSTLYILEDVREWLRSRKQSKSKDPVHLPEIRAKKEKWQARLAEQMFRVREKKLIPIEEVEIAWSQEVAAIRAKLLAFPQSVSDKLFRAATIEGLPGVEKVLFDSVHDVLRELSGVKEEV